jgi:predicted nucleic acid-binding protein
MVTVCDTAVLIAADRGDRRAGALALAAAAEDVDLVVPAGCVAQAWRNGARQAPLARFLAGCREVPLDARVARIAGERLATTRLTDVVDASVAVLARPGDTVLTGDVDDLLTLVKPGVQVDRFA